MQFKPKQLAIAIASAGLLTIYGCGGGGGGGSPATSNTFSGVAAVGAPIPSGLVKVVDATGATVGTATTGADGGYTLSFTPSQFTAPFVITVTGAIGSSDVTLVSVQPTNDSATVNITPITNAIAAQLSSTGNPLDLVANIAVDKANITTANINTTEQAFRTALADNMTAVGLSPSDNLMSGTFSAQLDKLLDNVRIQVTPSGETQISTSAGSAVDDLAPTTTQPAAAKVVILAKGTLPSAADIVNLPAPTAPVGIDVLEAARTALNNCFAVAVASGRSASHQACTSLATADYLHDGRDVTAEFGGYLSDSGNDGMQFRKPEILRQISTAAGREKLLIRLSAVRSDGIVKELTTVAENNRTANAGWQLAGNQRAFETFANGAATKRIIANDTTKNRYETGLNLYVGQKDPLNPGAATHIASAVVKGPGLPAAGLILKHKDGCDFLAIVPTLLTDPATVPCASLYRVRAMYANGSPFTPASNTHLFASPALTDAEIQANIKPLDLYRFDLTFGDTSMLTYWNRLRSRPLTVAEMGLVKFAEFDANTTALMTTATLYAGGTKPTVGWTVPDSGPRPYMAYFFHTQGSDRKFVPLSANSASIPCSGNLLCASNGDYVSIATPAATAQYMFQTVARNRFDTQLFTQISR